MPIGVGPPFIVAFTPMAWAIFSADIAKAIVNRIEIDAIEIDTSFKLLTRLGRLQRLIK